MAEEAAATQTAPGERRAGLSRERVLKAAVALADKDGIDSLSMRKLAQDVGVEAMSLYHYFRSKSELLDGMLDAVYAEFEPPGPDADWRDSIRGSAVSAHSTLLRHAWACSLLMHPTRPSRARLGWMDAILGRLRSAGFSVDMTHHAYHALDSHIVGFTLWVLPYIAIRREQPEFATDTLSNLPVQELPHLLEHIEYHMKTDDEPSDTSEFDFGLDLLLDGLERLREPGRPT
jgi:AcrR family transcriptional regulator